MVHAWCTFHMHITYTNTNYELSRSCLPSEVADIVLTMHVAEELPEAQVVHVMVVLTP